MDVHVNYLAVAVAAVASYVIAFIWYGLIFGKVWQKFTGITEMKPAPVNILLVLIGSFIMAYVLCHSLTFGDEYYQNHGAKMSAIQGGLMAGLFNWLGFIAPVTLCTKLYEKKPWGLWVMDNAFWLISLLVMGTILAVWV